VNVIPLLAIPFTVTTTLPLVAPAGTDVAMLVALQLVTPAAVPLKVTVPLDPKFAPVIVTAVPTFPDVGFKLVIEGPDVVVTVKFTPLLATPFTVTLTFPVVAPAGTDVAMLVGLQLVVVAALPLNVTVLVPCVDPKFIPVIVTGLPTGPDVEERFEIATSRP
jgi:hypothetical protein